MGGHEDLWEKAFQLAFFIVPDRVSACQVARRAIEKLGVQRSREKRRAYWRGRNAKLRIRRISRPDADALQWLVYLESEECEREQERIGRQTEMDMVVRYIKHLVQLATGASSFYVNVGLNRLLRNYGTPAVQRVYEFITEHYPASEEYRKVKGRLMDRLAARFDGFIKPCRSEYRELRFETYEDQKPWLGPVEECLESFTPWSSRDACLLDMAELEFGVPGTGLRHPNLASQVDGIETNRCHWFMHTPCYRGLAKELGLDPPEQKLSVPQFFLKNHDGEDPPTRADGRKTAPLTDAEMQALREHLDLTETKRQRAALQSLKIVAHGAVCAHLGALRDERTQFDIQDGTRLIEVWAKVDGADVLLATHWIDYTEWDGIAAGEYTIGLKDNRELLFKIVPADRGTDQEGGATVLVESRFRFSLGSWSQTLVSFLPRQHHLLRYAFASVVLVALGWLAATAHYHSKLAQEQSKAQHMAAEIASQKATVHPEQRPLHPAQIIATYFLSSQDPALRGTGNPAEPVVTFAPGDSLVMLDLSVVQNEHGLYRATLSSFPEEKELLRENLLRPIRSRNGPVVSFALPSSLVGDKTHYLVTLAALDSTGRVTPLARFLFEVHK